MYFYNVVSTIPFDKVSNKILKQVSMAATIAEESDFDSSKRLGASLEYKGYYFYGSNSHRNRVGKIDCISLHAEVNVLTKALKKFEKNANLKSKTKLPPSTIYVVRLMRKKENLPSYRSYFFGISKPCADCQKKLYNFNVTRIFYTDIKDGREVICEMKINKRSSKDIS